MVSLRAKLPSGAPSFGSWIASASPLTAEIMGGIGFDWVILDTQHGGISEPNLLPLLQALDATGTPALVRIPWPDPALIMRAADLGAAGVVLPMVNNAAEASQAVRAIRYPPRGIRSFGPVRGGYAGTAAAEDPLCIVMIETAEALQNLDAIARTPGLDGLLIGPVDLALSLGLGLSLQMPDAIYSVIETIVASCRANGLIAASVSFQPDNAAEQLRRGIKFLAYGSDTMFLRGAASQTLAELRQLPGDRP